MRYFWAILSRCFPRSDQKRVLVRLLRLGFGKRLGPRVDCPPPLAEPYIGGDHAPILLFTCLNYDSGVGFVSH